MMRFAYLGPPDEPEVVQTSAFGLDWLRGEPRDVADEALTARLRRHPHFVEAAERPARAPRKGRS